MVCWNKTYLNAQSETLDSAPRLPLKGQRANMSSSQHSAREGLRRCKTGWYLLYLPPLPTDFTSVASMVPVPPSWTPRHSSITISWPAPAVSTVDEESSWAGQSTLVDSPEQSVGDMSGKTFLLLLTVILCARAWFWSFPNSVVPVRRKWDDILNHMCRNNCEQWRSVGAWWRRRGTSITSAKKWAGKESVGRYCSYKATSMRSWRFAGNFVCVWVQNCYGSRATGYEEDLHVELLCHICLRISVSFVG